jgi:hypothetical protein
MAGTQPIMPQQFAISSMKQLWRHRASYAARRALNARSGGGAVSVERAVAARQSQTNGAVDPLRNCAAAITLSPDLICWRERGMSL